MRAARGFDRSRGTRALRIIDRMHPPTPTPRRPHIVIIGCGFGGLEAAHVLQEGAVDVTVIDRTNHHLFQPLLYQVATAGLAAPSIAAPVRVLFR
ncbi:MAG: FAD-dependent oxidoreductase, partial [Variovorax sp.]|nr:FAD-dependent oxidoreductase [Variovorax sp.]